MNFWRKEVEVNITGEEPFVEREVAAKIIDTSWIFSMHWPEQDWERQALKDANSSQEGLLDEMVQISTKLGHLSKVKMILERAVAYYHERQLPEVASE